MNLTINGESGEYSSSTLSDLIEEIGAERGKVAALINDAVVRRQDYPTTLLNEGDRIEILTMAGGG